MAYNGHEFFDIRPVLSLRLAKGQTAAYGAVIGGGNCIHRAISYQNLPLSKAYDVSVSGHLQPICLNSIRIELSDCKSNHTWSRSMHQPH